MLSGLGDIEPEALARLKECAQTLPHTEHGCLGKRPHGYAIRALLDVTVLGVSDEPETRDQLAECFHDESLSTQALSVRVLAWGGMKLHHCGWAFEKADYWLPICQELRGGMLSPLDAYKRFYDLREIILGMGPAYYTKLIYFFSGGDAMIMDQWTLKSVNLLYPETRVQTKWTGNSVAKQNAPAVYELFNSAILDLTKRVHIPLKFRNTKAEFIERLIFSHSPAKNKRPKRLSVPEHQNLSRWRRYVKKSWS